MNIELIKQLVEKAQENGSAKYRSYLLKKEHSGFELSMNKKIMANFIVTGYEQGYIENSVAKTEYQVKTVESLKNFLTGQY